MIASLRLAATVAMPCLSARAMAETDPTAANGLLGVLDTPSTRLPRQGPTPRGSAGSPWTIACFDYPGYRVKALVGGEGDDIVSTQVLPPGTRPPPCGPQDDPGEKVISRQNYFFAGAKGGFAMLVSPEGYGIQIDDVASGKQVYRDTADYTKVRRFDVVGDTATITYTRYVAGPCPVLTEGPACVQRFVRESKLPPELAQTGAPMSACEAAYQHQGPNPTLKREDFTVLTYIATVKVDRTGRSTTLSRTTLECLSPG